MKPRRFESETIVSRLATDGPGSSDARRAAVTVASSVTARQGLQVDGQRRGQAGAVDILARRGAGGRSWGVGERLGVDRGRGGGGAMARGVPAWDRPDGRVAGWAVGL